MTVPSWSGCARQATHRCTAARNGTANLEPPKRPALYLWAVLMARIYEVFPLLCPICGGQMRVIAFITHSADIRRILDHIGAASAPPHIAPARGPPGCYENSNWINLRGSTAYASPKPISYLASYG